MRTLLIATALCLAAATTAAAQDFNWHGRIAPGKRLEGKGVNGGVRATAASGAGAIVTATKRARRSDPDEVKIEVGEAAGGGAICAGYPTPGRARQEKDREPGGKEEPNTQDNEVTG